MDKPAYDFIVGERRRQRKSKVFMVAMVDRSKVALTPTNDRLSFENRMTILSIGEILWDVYPDTLRLGGAPFNFAVNAQRLGHRVVFLSATGDDEMGGPREAGGGTGFGDGIHSGRAAGQARGRVTVGLDSEGHPEFTIHRPAAYDFLRLGEEQLGRSRSCGRSGSISEHCIRWSCGARDKLRRLSGRCRKRAVFTM